MQRAFVTVLALLPIIGIVGCGAEGTAGRPKTFPVSGVVKLSEQPVAGAAVTFQLTSGGGSAAGITDASGKYTLSSYGGGDGAVAGDYSVTIVKLEGAAAAPAASGGLASGAIDESAYNAPAESAAPAEPKNLLPPKYATAATSGLKARVSESGGNQIDFNLQP